MRIGPNTVVAIDYRLTLDSGEVVDSSETRSPLRFLYGRGHLIPALEREIEGMEAGHEKDVTLSPDEGYGSRSETLLRDFPRDAFPPEVELKEGVILYAEAPEGRRVPFTVRAVGPELVRADFNHPLAGESLHFWVAVREVREASVAEVEQGELREP